MHIRRAVSSDLDHVNRIAFAAKAHWGYTREQMALWLHDLMTAPETIEAWPTTVAEGDGGIMGFAQLDPRCSPWELVSLFVSPEHMRQQVGRALLRICQEIAAQAGQDRIVIDSDPHAAPFYLACGAEHTGTVPAPLPGQPERGRPQLRLPTKAFWLHAQPGRDAGIEAEAAWGYEPKWFTTDYGGRAAKLLTSDPVRCALRAVARRLRLNTELVTKPKDLLEFVVVHELLHLIEPNHSERFFALITEHYPSWQQARTELNDLPLGTENWTGGCFSWQPRGNFCGRSRSRSGRNRDREIAPTGPVECTNSRSRAYVHSAPLAVELARGWPTSAGTESAHWPPN